MEDDIRSSTATGEAQDPYGAVSMEDTGMTTP